MGLNGWVCNRAGDVLIEVSGTEERLAHFIRRIRSDAPPLADIASLHHHALPDDNFSEGFSIRESSAERGRTIHIAPDSATCPACLNELNSPTDRRYRYPFITCTDCGPRYSIITAAPYDRPNTTMACFPLCEMCEQEYHDPGDRRFHAQPIGCHICGPRLELTGTDGWIQAHDQEAILLAQHALAEGKILAVKGIGGYHLAVDAENHEAVAELRRRKRREEKPFAVMAANLEIAHRLADMDGLEERLLVSPEAPIVIVRRRDDARLAVPVAPGNGWIGLMLPYTPLHHLLFAPVRGSRIGGQGSTSLPGAATPEPRTLFQSLVMTSANLSDEPIIYRDDAAIEQLAGIADAILSHNRLIHIPQDDSVIRVFQGRPLFYRRARGYVPRPIALPFETPPLLAAGAELKSTLCLAANGQAFVSQHLGDLKSDPSCDLYRSLAGDLRSLLDITPEAAACDQHPDFHSTLFAESLHLPLIRVQHHHAHLAACMAENALAGPVLGVIFDGTGYGPDGSVWGGEFLVGDYEGFQRAGHFLPVRLPGGDKAVHEPWRMALSYLYRTLGETAFHLNHPVVSTLTASERPIFIAMLEQGFNSPLTSSCGRLFDAAAALLEVRQTVTYDGQAAIELEALAETADSSTDLPYRILNDTDGPLQLDFTGMFPAILRELQAGRQRASLAASVHDCVGRATVDACLRIAAQHGITRIVLSGGVFQNRLLSEKIYTGLANRDMQVFTHRLVPPNDGCIALGQAAIAGWQTRRSD